VNINTTDFNNVSNGLYAAVDLGSNSFHMVVSRYELGEFVVIDRHRATVRLAAGLDEEGHITDEAERRALETLEQFSQLLRDIPNENIRVVGTNAMRRMLDSQRFIDKAERQLGASIEIIAGREEARLIYLGVVKGAEFGDASRIVIDIGGGSTEVIVGNSDEPQHRESLEVGCVVLSQRHFKDGVLSKERFKKAVLDAKLAIQPYSELFKNQGWKYAIGCSGTIKALSNILDAMDWAQGEITRAALDRLYEHTIGAGSIDDIELPGLNDERKPVFAGGLSVLMAIFEELNIERMQVSDCALRDGVLYDLIGRSSENDVREVAVNALVERCGVDIRHASFVKKTANMLYSEIASSWDIDSDLYEKMLAWASLTHEIGMLISHDGYHKHGSYLLSNADMVGFARRDQALLACLIKGHRGKFPIKDFEKLPATIVTPAKRLAVILRLAVLLHRTRNTKVLTDLRVETKNISLELTFPDGWLEKHPLTQADLEQEIKRLSLVGFELIF
jgi:exopolyphosphatase/guanosine-5'-triphosphate,3'-diphosphate pyrophosphatase